MTEQDEKSPAKKTANRALAAREVRLKAALKANMARRKAQTKARGHNNTPSGAELESPSGTKKE